MTGKPEHASCVIQSLCATRPDPGRPKNLYVREDHILPRLAALAILQASDDHGRHGTAQGGARITVPAQAADLIDRLRAVGVTLTYEPDTKTLRTGNGAAVTVSAG